jgi:hypothetical protein
METHDVLQAGGATEGKFLELGPKVANFIGLLLELTRVVDPVDVLLESLWAPIQHDAVT